MTEQVQKKSKLHIEIRTLTEYLYLLMLAGGMLLFAISRLTTFDAGIPGGAFPAWRALAAAVSVANLLVNADNMKKEYWLFGLVVFACFFPGFLRNYPDLIDLAILVIGAAQIPHRKILKVFFVVGSTLLLITVLASMCGVLPDIVYLRGSDARVRHAFGTIYPTDCMAYTTLLLLVGYALYGGVLFPLLGAGAFWVAWKYCDARNSQMVLILFIAVSALMWFIDHEKEKTAGRRVKQAVDVLLRIAMPAFALIMAVLTALYRENSALMVRLDHIANQRLSLGHNAMIKYGVRLAGSSFDMVGNGGTTASTGVYNFIDSSYALILIRYGVLLFVTVCILYYVTVKRFQKAGNYRVPAAFALFALSCVMEHHLTEVAFGVFLYLAFADPENDAGQIFAADPKGGKDPKTIRRRRLSLQTGGAVLAALFIRFVLPHIVDPLRSAVFAMNLGAKQKYVLFIMLFLVFGIIAVIECARLIKKLKPEQKRAGRLLKILDIAAGCVMVLCVLAAGYQCKKAVSAVLADPGTAELAETDGGVLAALTDGGYTGAVYADEYAAVYRKKGLAVDTPRLYRNGLTDAGETVYLTSASLELTPLLKHDYAYIRTGKTRAVYTNSETAREILKDLAYQEPEKADGRTEVDLERLAAFNALPFVSEEESGIMVTGRHFLRYGPFLFLSKGETVFEMEILLCSEAEPGQTVASVSVTANDKEQTLAYLALTKADFDADGKAVISVPVRTKQDLPNIETLIHPADDAVLKVTRISYGKDDR